MKVAAILYHHRHGDDVLLVTLSPKAEKRRPKITNKLLRRLGVFEPELERDDESVEWIGPFEASELPAV